MDLRHQLSRLGLHQLVARLAPAKALPVCWRRLRYCRASDAADALTRLADAGAAVHLRLRRSGGVTALYAGFEDTGWQCALAELAPVFGLEAELTTAAAPLAGPLVPGNWSGSEVPDEADAVIMPPGVMYVTDTAAQAPCLSVPGAEIALPAPGLGLAVQPALPYPAHDPADGVWRLGQSSVPAPAGLVAGTDSARNRLASAFAAQAVQGESGVLVVDGTGGQVALALRDHPAVRALLASGRLVELSLSKARLRGFNPLAESRLSPSVTLWRWFWWWAGGGLGVHDKSVVEAAYRRGTRSLAGVAAVWEAGTDTRLAARAMHELQGYADVFTWMSGTFDVARHLAAGGHLLVTCAGATGARLQALRGLLALAAESESARVLSVGVRWSADSIPLLYRMDALCTGRSWVHTVYAQCSQEVATVVASRLHDLRFIEYLTRMPGGMGLVHSGGNWGQVHDEGAPLSAAAPVAVFPHAMPAASRPAWSASPDHIDVFTPLRAARLRTEAQALISEIEPASGKTTGGATVLRCPTLLEAYGASHQEALRDLEARLAVLDPLRAAAEPDAPEARGTPAA
jgi:hypothetical protein